MVVMVDPKSSTRKYFEDDSETRLGEIVFCFLSLHSAAAALYSFVQIYCVPTPDCLPPKKLFLISEKASTYI
jgi:hypothetical protein